MEAWIEKYRLELVVVNQFVNLKSTAQENRVLELRTLAVGTRAIAKRQRCVMVLVGQAGETGENRRVLRMGDFEFSNTVVQAQMDLIIGIGTDEAMPEGYRMWSLPKNKLGGIHDPFMVPTDPWRNRVK